MAEEISLDIRPQQEDGKADLPPDPVEVAAASGAPSWASDEADAAEVHARERGLEKDRGEVTLEAGETPPPQWQDPMEALLSPVARELPEDDFYIERVNGVRMKIRLRAIATSRYDKIQSEHTTRKMDKQVREIRDHVNEEALKAALIIESAQNIDFHDPKLRAFYDNPIDDQTLIRRAFLKGEIEQMAVRIAELSGFERTFLEQQAGNS